MGAAPCFAGQPAYVAGAFYPADPAELEGVIERALGGARAPRADDPRALVVPHAGYIFSGDVAAAAFREIRGRDYPLVILVGLAHRAAVEGAALDPAGAFDTPLGSVQVDREAASRLKELCPLVHDQPSAFVEEHSLEVEIPFLQKTLSTFKIVPLLMQEPDIDAARTIGQAIAQLVEEREARGERVLLVASTDLAHYPRDTEARRSDEAILRKIAALDPQGLSQEAKAQISKGVPNLATAICGEAGVLAVLYAARALGATRGEVLKHATSADSPAGDLERTVGYGAVALYGGSAPARSQAASGTAEAAGPLTKEQEERLLQLARKSLTNYLSTGSLPVLIPSADEALRVPAAVFVTLEKDGKLRGCIGTTLPELPLEDAVQRYAIAAGTQDSRFLPVVPEELDSLSLEISILSPPRRVPGPEEVRVGEDGVVLVQGKRSGLFLPQVWHDTGWSREEFLSELAHQKAGLPPDAWKDPATELSTFTVHSFEDSFGKRSPPSSNRSAAQIDRLTSI